MLSGKLTFFDPGLWALICINVASPRMSASGRDFEKVAAIQAQLGSPSRPTPTILVKMSLRLTGRKSRAKCIIAGHILTLLQVNAIYRCGRQ